MQPMKPTYQGMDAMMAAKGAEQAMGMPERGDFVYHQGNPVTVIHVSDFGNVTHVPGHVPISSARLEEFTRHPTDGPAAT
jgi:hypothetical protein